MRSGGPVVVVAALAALALACDRGAPAPAPAPAASPAPPAPAARPGRERQARTARRAQRIREVSGTVVRADERRLAVRSPTGPELTVRLVPGTSLTLGGRRSSPGALRPGDEVRVSYRSGGGGAPTAIAVEARRAPAPAPEEPVGTDRG